MLRRGRFGGGGGRGGGRLGIGGSVGVGGWEMIGLRRIGGKYWLDVLLDLRLDPCLRIPVGYRGSRRRALAYRRRRRLLGRRRRGRSFLYGIFGGCRWGGGGAGCRVGL